MCTGFILFKMMKVTSTLFALFAALVLGGPVKDENSIFSILKHKELLSKMEGTLSDGSLLHRDACTLTEEEWMQLKSAAVEYAVESKDVNYETGTFNVTYIDTFLDKKEKDNYEAAVCDEWYNMQEDMDTKIAYIYKVYILRQGNCGLPGKEETCKGKEEAEVGVEVGVEGEEEEVEEEQVSEEPEEKEDEKEKKKRAHKSKKSKAKRSKKSHKH